MGYVAEDIIGTYNNGFFFSSFAGTHNLSSIPSARRLKILYFLLDLSGEKPHSFFFLNILTFFTFCPRNNSKIPFDIFLQPLEKFSLKLSSFLFSILRSILKVPFSTFKDFNKINLCKDSFKKRELFLKTKFLNKQRIKKKLHSSVNSRFLLAHFLKQTFS